MKKLLYLVTLLVIMLSCGEALEFGPSDFVGNWETDKATAPFGNAIMSITFTPNEQDSTSGKFVLLYDGTCRDSDSGVEFNVHYIVAEMGTYAIDGSELTLNYMPDSIGTDVDQSDIELHAAAKARNGDNRDIEEITEEFGTLIYGYIESTFRDEFIKRNTDNNNRYRAMIKNRTLSLRTIGTTDRINLLRTDY